MHEALPSQGTEVSTLTDSEQAATLANAEAFAGVFLDLQMPGMSGLELQSRLVASKSRVPIVFISAHSDSEARARALEAGAVGFLQKPFSEDALLNAIKLSLTIDTGRGHDRPDPNPSI